MAVNNLRRICWWLATLLVVGTVGCGRGDNRVERFPLSGTVSFEGKPVPAGWIVLSPASGPGASADLVDGKFTTPQGYGTVGGPHTIEITAMEGVTGLDPNDEGAGHDVSKIFTCTIERDIPKEATTLTIELSYQDIGAKKGQVKFKGGESLEPAQP